MLKLKWIWVKSKCLQKENMYIYTHMYTYIQTYRKTYTKQTKLQWDKLIKLKKYEKRN